MFYSALSFIQFPSSAQLSLHADMDDFDRISKYRLSKLACTLTISSSTKYWILSGILGLQ